MWLATPIAGTNMLTMLMGIVDTIIVGHHSAQELAELALAWSLNGTSFVAVIGLTIGASVMVSRRIGEGRPEDVGPIWRRAAISAVLAGFVLALLLNWGAAAGLRLFGQDETLIAGASSAAHILALSLVPLGIYMASSKTVEALGAPRLSLLVLIGANLVNLGLNLVWVPDHGADGSAWATFVSRCFCAIAIVLLMLRLGRGKAYGFLKPVPASRDRAEFARERREQLSIGFAALGSRVLEAASFNAMTLFAGAHGVIGIATFSIFMNALSFGFMPAIGLAQATAVLASRARGAGQSRAAVRVGWMGLALGAVWGLVTGLIGFVGAAPIAAVFTADAMVAAAGAALLAAWIMVTVTDYTQVILAEAMRALGAAWFPTISHLGSYVCVMIPLGWLLCVHFDRGAWGLMEAVAVASLVSLLLLSARWALLVRSLTGASVPGGAVGQDSGKKAVPAHT